jgi:cysteine desulfurase
LNVVEAEIYLDAAATTPPRKDVIEAVVYAQQEAWGNPSSLHNTGVKAAEFLERLRWKLADRFAVAPDQLIFTSGATESVHLAILGSATTLPPGRIVLSGVEHPAVLGRCGSIEEQGVDRCVLAR